MKKTIKKAIKGKRSDSQKVLLTETILPYREKPSKEGERLAAHNLFSLFTANIIQENIEFTR